MSKDSLSQLFKMTNRKTKCTGDELNLCIFDRKKLKAKVIMKIVFFKHMLLDFILALLANSLSIIDTGLIRLLSGMYYLHRGGFVEHLSLT